VRTTEELEAGMELEVEYLAGAALLQGREARAGALRNWGIECRCRRCVAEDPFDVAPTRSAPTDFKQITEMLI
jgi:hypothetical protein